MSVLIKGAKMPKCCFECVERCVTFEGESCKVTKELIYDISIRPVSCPLVEIPRHDRLIDANETKRVFGDYFEKVKVARRYAESLVDNAIPTAIESEEE